MNVHRKKRKYEMGRPSSMTKLRPDGERRVHTVRVRGGATKFRALRLSDGVFSWGSEGVARRVRILDVVYNATSNELVRTKTLVKGAVVVVEGNPYRNWYYKQYGVQLLDTSNMKQKDKEKEGATEIKAGKSLTRKWAERSKSRTIDAGVQAQLEVTGSKLMARITSRPGQCGKADGYILEGKELEFYSKKIEKKKKGGKKQ